ncbi:MAG: glycosyltransferase family 39 protein [Solirubrobacterales bacterium]|nr:glycosyltransferase family 39 protein [Solirubrobacterales bacterium]
MDLLRLPGLLLGALVVVLTAATARRVCRDRFAPALAAAIVAFIPTFLMISTGVSNDVLANALAALATWLAVIVAGGSLRQRPRMAACAGLGALVAALVQTKLTGIFLLPAAGAAVWWSAKSWRLRGRLLGTFGAGVALAGGWWLIYNTRHYGDPLALAASARVNRLLGGPLEYAGVHPLRQIFVEVPRTVWKQFWYIFQQFEWPWWAYIPFWGLTATALGALVASRKRERVPSATTRVLGLFALGGLASVWAIGVQDRAAQARLAFIGLPALACLIALGAERLPGPRAARLALPALGLGASIVVLGTDIMAMPG